MKKDLPMHQINTVFYLRNKTTGELFCRARTKTPSVWVTKHGAATARASKGKKAAEHWDIISINTDTHSARVL